jgi:L-aminopeptidase/D-esterase-like protein
MLHGFPGMKGGLGTASLRLGKIVIGALVVLNAAGDIVDWRADKIVAGARRPDGKGFADVVETLKTQLARSAENSRLELNDAPLHSTTLVVVATNVDFSKTQLTKIAMMANCGAARAIRPYHTTGDGDQLFAVSTNRLKTNVGITALGAVAAEVVSEAILRAVKTASTIDGWLAYRDYAPGV